MNEHYEKRVFHVNLYFIFGINDSTKRILKILEENFLRFFFMINKLVSVPKYCIFKENYY